MLGNLLRPREVRSTFPTMSQGDYFKQLEQLMYMGNRYQVSGNYHEATEYALSNAAVAAVVNFRQSVFSEATFKFQSWQNGRPGQLFGAPALATLERPWQGAGTSHLLASMDLDATVYGNSYWIRAGAELARLNPEHVTIITEEVLSLEGVPVSQRLIGYAYAKDRHQTATIFLPGEVAHYYTHPDPENPFRGCSWLRAVLADVDADSKMTGYKNALLQNSAVPGMVLKAEPGISPEQVTAAREALRARNTGWDKVGRTLILGSGFDPVTVGQNMQQLDMKSLQGAGESRIAAAGGVSPVLVGFSEGLQGSSLNSGNYGAARRRFADGTVRPMWRAACTALSVLVPPPAGARLWIDTGDVSFLQEDEQDEATIRETRARAIRTLVDAGYDPNAASQYVATGDVSVLTDAHSGLYSVQLQPAGATQPEPARAVEPVVEVRATPEPVQQQFTFNFPEQRFETTIPVQNDVHVPEQRETVVTVQPTPVQVNVQPTPVQNTVNVEPTPVKVDARTTVQAPVVNVTNDVQPAPVTVLDDGPSKKVVKFNKDSDGRITGATVTED